MWDVDLTQVAYYWSAFTQHWSITARTCSAPLDTELDDMKTRTRCKPSASTACSFLLLWWHNTLSFVSLFYNVRPLRLALDTNLQTKKRKKTVQLRWRYFRHQLDAFSLLLWRHNICSFTILSAKAYDTSSTPSMANVRWSSMRNSDW